jgi:hypothetical protein
VLPSHGDTQRSSRARSSHETDHPTRWEDGEALDPATAAILNPVVAETERFWKLKLDFADQ